MNVKPMISTRAMVTVLVVGNVVMPAHAQSGFQAEPVVAANPHMIEAVVWPHFWVIQLWLVVLLFVYCAFREFGRAVGRQKVMPCSTKVSSSGPARRLTRSPAGGARSDPVDLGAESFGVITCGHDPQRSVANLSREPSVPIRSSSA